MPDSRPFQWFNEELAVCLNNSQRPEFPMLNLWVYITRGEVPDKFSTGNEAFTADNFQCGKPDFDAICEVSVSQNPNKSMLVFACGPEIMVNQTWDSCALQKSQGNRLDFHHETFDW